MVKFYLNRSKTNRNRETNSILVSPKTLQSSMYFQEIMATVVLVGLIYMICEMYIDDCSVFGDTNIEFVSRLRLVFERFRKQIGRAHV